MIKKKTSFFLFLFFLLLLYLNERFKNTREPFQRETGTGERPQAFCLLLFQCFARIQLAMNRMNIFTRLRLFGGRVKVTEHAVASEETGIRLG